MTKILVALQCTNQSRVNSEWTIFLNEAQGTTTLDYCNYYFLLIALGNDLLHDH